MMPAAMKLFNEMSRVLNSNFDPITKIDACKMLVLMYRTSRNTELAFLPFLFPYLMLVLLMLMTNSLFAILTIATGIAFFYYLEQKRKDALNELSNLVYSNPAYWEPIRNKLRESIGEEASKH